jgi:DnaJ-class molecular chaperone
MRIALLVLVPLLQAGPDALTRKIVQAFGSPDSVDPADDAKAKGSPEFGPRYAALVLEIHRCVARGAGFESTYRSLVGFTTQNGPRGAADHVRTLAASFKKAVYCKECKDGKIVCEECKGKGKLNQKCSACGGEGRTRPPGAVGKTDITVKCRNCDGNGFFKDAGCPGCAKTGQKNCPACLGRPWHDRKCSVAECRDGRIRCAECGGKCKVHPKCGECDGKGRIRPAGAVGGTDLLVKCRACDGKGVVDQELKCPACGANGFVPCKACSADEKSRFKVPLSEIFSTSPCSCSGKGTPCSSCVGLGLRVAPAIDPSKTLD